MSGSFERDEQVSGSVAEGPTPELMRVLGYCRVSTQEQAESGAGLAAQRSAIEAEAARRGWELVRVFEDAGASGKSLNRPGLADALAALKSGDASALLVAKLDRLSRSVHDFAAVMRLSERQRWALVALDLGIDTTTPAGGLIANVMASVAEWERRIIGERTKAALAVRRSQGVTLGRPREVTPAVVERIHEIRSTGLSLAGTARELNREGLLPPRGKAWYPDSIRRVLNWSEAA